MWASLPPELLLAIADRCVSADRLEQARFLVALTGVCRSWRHGLENPAYIGVFVRAARRLFSVRERRGDQAGLLCNDVACLETDGLSQAMNRQREHRGVAQPALVQHLITDGRDEQKLHINRRVRGGRDRTTPRPEFCQRAHDVTPRTNFWAFMMPRLADDCLDVKFYSEFTEKMKSLRETPQSEPSVVPTPAAAASSCVASTVMEELAQLIALERLWKYGDEGIFRVSVWGLPRGGKSSLISTIMAGFERLGGWEIQSTSAFPDPVNSATPTSGAKRDRPRTVVRYTLAAGRVSNSPVVLRVLIREVSWADTHTVFWAFKSPESDGEATEMDRFVDLHCFVTDTQGFCENHLANYDCLHDALGRAGGQRLRVWVFATRTGNGVEGSCGTKHVDESLRIHELSECMFYRNLDVALFGVPEHRLGFTSFFGKQCARLLVKLLCACASAPR